MRTALITGGSRGFGRAAAAALAQRGWHVVVDARDPAELAAAVAASPGLVGINGDVADPRHRDRLVEAVRQSGRLDLLVNNAGTLGPTPLPRLAGAPLDGLRSALELNVVAPLALVQAVLPMLRDNAGVLVGLTSDAATSPYATWGVYGATKAALDQLTAVLGEEEELVRAYALDPGDMRTRMHQDAFPGEDISDRPLPEAVVPALLRLLDERPPSGRYTAAQLLPVPA